MSCVGSVLQNQEERGEKEEKGCVAAAGRGVWEAGMWRAGVQGLMRYVEKYVGEENRILRRIVLVYCVLFIGSETLHKQLELF